MDGTVWRSSIARSRPAGARSVVPHALALLAVLAAAGCASGPPGAAVDSLDLVRDIRIPPGTAHTVFQGGRQVAGASRLDPYCELEIETVSERPQWAKAGPYRVRGARFALLRDPTTRLPALFGGVGCSDPLFQESLWLLRSDRGGNVHSLRCIRPGYHCSLGPPIALTQAPELLGPGVVAVPAGP